MELDDFSTWRHGALFVSLDLEEALAEPGMCVACGAAGVTTTGDASGTLFRCPTCGQAWRATLGMLVLVEPEVPQPRQPA